MSLTKWLVKPFFSSMSAMLAEVAMSSGSWLKSLREAGGEETLVITLLCWVAPGCEAPCKVNPCTCITPFNTPLVPGSDTDQTLTVKAFGIGAIYQQP